MEPGSKMNVVVCQSGEVTFSTMGCIVPSSAYRLTICIKKTVPFSRPHCARQVPRRYSAAGEGGGQIKEEGIKEPRRRGRGAGSGERWGGNEREDPQREMGE